jgi:glyoxylase-like metal-dependent hydrolase (beta-lactamase superfamily II)
MDFKIVQIPQPFSEPTNVIRIGDTLIDTGHVDDASTAVLRDQLESGDLKGVKEVIITHPHVDHVSASAGLPEIAKMPHTVFRGAEQVIENLADYLLKAREQQRELLAGADETLSQMVEFVARAYFPAEREYGALNISRIVESGDDIRAGQVDLRVIHTPGHEANHMALFNEASGVLLSGDLIANSAHFNKAPLTPDIAQYERSLQIVLELRPKLIVPSHGHPIEDAMAHVKKCLENVNDIKGRILKSLENLGEATHVEIEREVFASADQSKAGALALVILCYLECLELEGKVSLDKASHIARLK